MNILFLSRDYPPNPIGGVGIYVYEASRLLAKLGHQTFVITEAQEHPAEYVDQGVRVFRVVPKKLRIFNPLRGKLNNFIERLEYSYAVSKKIREIAPRYNIDVIESSEARAEGLWHYLFKNKPALVIKLHTPEGIVYKLNRDPMTKERWLIEQLEEWWIRRAHKVIGLSSAIVSLTQNHYKMRLNNIPIVANPIDLDTFNTKGSANNKGYILYVGRLEYRKGVQVLIRSIPGILEKFPQARFVFVGSDCGMKQYLLDKALKFGIKDSVDFVGQVSRPELITYYQQSALCVVPSLWENHPYVVLEAMACGKPVIATDVGGIPEIVKDKINGILVPAGSVISLTHSIVEVLSNKKLQETLGNNARKYIEGQYACGGVMQRTLDIYTGLKG